MHAHIYRTRYHFYTLPDSHEIPTSPHSFAPTYFDIPLVGKIPVLYIVHLITRSFSNIHYIPTAKMYSSSELAFGALLLSGYTVAHGTVSGIEIDGKL